MKKMINRTTVEGTLVEKNLRTGMTKANVPYVAGKLNIDTGKDNVIAVDVFEQQKTSKGMPNGKYDILSSIFNNGRTIHDDSENPTTLRISSALELRDWVVDGQQRTSLVNNGGFITIISNPDRKAQFEVDVVIKSIQEEIDGGDSGEFTGRVILNGLIFNYRNQALPVKFVVENPDGIQFFKSQDLPVFTKIWGVQVISTSSKSEPSAFGGAKVVQSGYTRKELIVTGAQTIPYEEDQLNQEELKAAIQARNVVVAEILSSQNSTTSTPTPAATKPKTGSFSF